MDDPTLSKKGAELLAKCDELAGKLHDQLKLIEELRTQAEWMLDGIDPAQVKGTRPYPARGRWRRKGTEFLFKDGTTKIVYSRKERIKALKALVSADNS